MNESVNAATREFERLAGEMKGERTRGAPRAQLAAIRAAVAAADNVAQLKAALLRLLDLAAEG